MPRAARGVAHGCRRGPPSEARCARRSRLNAPGKKNPPAPISATVNDPIDDATIAPVNVVIRIPAGVDATWRDVGATSAGNAQMLAAANARLPYDTPKHASISGAFDVKRTL
jgi:hypothetical protein